MEHRLAEYEDARLDAEATANRTEELRAELEERLAEEENMNENLQDKLESELRKREEADAQAKIDLQQQATLLKRQTEQDVVLAIKSQRAQEGTVTHELVQAEQAKYLEVQTQVEQERELKLALQQRLEEEASARQALEDKLRVIEEQKAQFAVEEEGRRTAAKAHALLCTHSSKTIQRQWRIYTASKRARASLVLHRALPALARCFLAKCIVRKMHAVKYAAQTKLAGHTISLWLIKMRARKVKNASQKSTLRASACLASAKAAQDSRVAYYNTKATSICKFFLAYRGVRRCQILVRGFARLIAVRRAGLVRARSSKAVQNACKRLLNMRARSNANIGMKTAAALDTLRDCKQVCMRVYIFVSVCFIHSSTHTNPLLQPLLPQP